MLSELPKTHTDSRLEQITHLLTADHIPQEYAVESISLEASSGLGTSSEKDPFRQKSFRPYAPASAEFFNGTPALVRRQLEHFESFPNEDGDEPEDQENLFAKN